MMCAFRKQPPPWAVHLTALAVQTQKEIRQLMALVQIDQTALDALATSLEAVKTSLSDEIASLQTQLPEADLSGLNQALTDLEGLETPPASS